MYGCTLSDIDSSDKSVEISAWCRKFCPTKRFVRRKFCPIFQYKSQAKIGQNYRNFGLVSKVLSDKKFCPSKIQSNISIQKSGKNWTTLSKFQLGVENFVRRKFCMKFCSIRYLHNILQDINTDIRNLSSKFLINIFKIGYLTKQYKMLQKAGLQITERPVKCEIGHMT